MDKLKQILNRIIEFWNKYTRKQKGILISVIAVVVIAFVILFMVVKQPTYVTVTQCGSYEELSEVTALLTSSGYEYDLDEVNLIVRVKQADLTNAKMALATADIKSDGYSLEDALNSGFSTTESDKTRFYQKYLEYKFAEDLERIDGIKDASVSVTLPKDTHIFVSNKEEASVSAVLNLTSRFDTSAAESIAEFLATSVGNTNTAKITIISTSGETIFSGANKTYASNGSMSSSEQERYRAMMEGGMKTNIREGILSMGLYDDVTSNLHLDYDFDYVKKVLTEYSVPEGQEQGYLSESYEQHSTGNNGASGVPGTSSNDDDTSYMLSDGYGNYSEYTAKQYKYLPNVLVTTTDGVGAKINYENSTLAVTLKKNVVYKEAEAEALGYVTEDKTWEQFKSENSQPVKIEYDEEWLEYLAYSTGIDAANITIIAYENHFFEDIDTTGEGQPVSFWVQIALAGVILALLAIVVIRSARPLTVEETEPELSVEEMLATTKENQPTVEDIDLQNKSETRKAIEKFVDESPEAVALLLRNWLNEGWE